MSDSSQNDQDLPRDLGIARRAPKRARRSAWIWGGLVAVLASIGGFVIFGMDLPAPALPAPNGAAAQSGASRQVEAPDLTHQVAALGRLEPLGEVIDVAAPVTASESRILELRVVVGDEVEAGDVIAILANAPRMEAQLRRARADLAAQLVEFDRARDAFRLEQINAQAALRIAEIELSEAERVLARQDQLSRAGNAAQTALDEARRDQAVRAAQLDQARARFAEVDVDIEVHPNVQAARLAVERAEAEVAIARVDVAQTRVTAPGRGVVLGVETQMGESPGTGGIVRLADTDVMVVRMEVHQNRIHRVRVGDPVMIVGEALAKPLMAYVSTVGLEVLEQGLIGTDPVVSNNARVFEVTATLDAPSTTIAAELINLQVLATIEVDG